MIRARRFRPLGPVEKSSLTRVIKLSSLPDGETSATYDQNSLHIRQILFARKNPTGYIRPCAWSFLPSDAWLRGLRNGSFPFIPYSRRAPWCFTCCAGSLIAQGGAEWSSLRQRQWWEALGEYPVPPSSELCACCHPRILGSIGRIGTSSPRVKEARNLPGCSKHSRIRNLLQSAARYGQATEQDRRRNQSGA